MGTLNPTHSLTHLLCFLLLLLYRSSAREIWRLLSGVPSGGGSGLVCEDGETACSDGSACFSEQDRCDEFSDCDDDSDEQNCQSTCDDGEFLCADDDTCYPNLYWCDGQEDCSDGSDEASCELSAQHTSSVLTIIADFGLEVYRGTVQMDCKSRPV